MATGKQIRAARQLIEWTAEELAKRARLTKECILGIERGDKRPRASTTDKIVRVFNDAGIEFIGEQGVTLRNDQITTITGDNTYIRLLDDVFHTLNGTNNPEALFFFVDNSKSPSTVVATHQRIRESGIKCRYLCHERPERLDFPSKDYRAIPDKFFHNNTAIIYGDKYAIMILDPHTTKDAAAIIIRNPHVSESQKNLFNLIWASSKEVSYGG